MTQERNFAVFKHLTGGCREDGARLCSEMFCDRTRNNREKLQHGKFSLHVGKTFLPSM